MGLEDDLKKVQEVKSKGNQELTALRQRVIEGESFGDPIKDYIFISYGTTEFPAAEEKLQNLSKTVQAHHGHQVMILYTKTELTEKGGCFGSDRYENTLVGQQLGVLNGELKFDLEKGGILLPTAKYVQKGHDPYFIFDCQGVPWKLEEGNILIPGYHLRISLSMEESTLPSPEMFFGDEVELYFTSSSNFEIYNKSKKGSEDQKAVLERGFQRRIPSWESPDQEYLTICDLLSVEVPPRFREKHNHRLAEKKEEVVKNLGDGKDVRHYLQQAVTLGLHKEPREIELEPGIKMNVADYVTAQCEKYKIEIPK